MTHDEMIAVIAHHKNGGKVQFLRRNETKWVDTSDPLWEFSIGDYRAKPEPLALWVTVTPDGSHYSTHESKELAVDTIVIYNMDRPRAKHLTLKKFVEEEVK